MVIANTLSRKHPSIAINNNQSTLDTRKDFDLANNKAYEILTETQKVNPSSKKALKQNQVHH